MDESAIYGMIAGYLVFMALVFAFFIIMFWKIFVKAGQPGWAAIIPIYNLVVLIQIAGKPVWWIVLLFVPLVNIVIAFLLCQGLATNFGKGTGFAVGLFFLGIIFYPILAFGSAEYQG